MKPRAVRAILHSRILRSNLSLIHVKIRRSPRPKFLTYRFVVCESGRSGPYLEAFIPLKRVNLATHERNGMEYQVVIGRDRKAGVWFVSTTNVPGLALEDPSLDNLLEKLPEAIAWLLRKQKTQDQHEVPFDVLLLEHERARIAG